MQILSQDKSGKWKMSQSRLHPGRGKPPLPFRCKKWPHVFLLVSIQQQRWIPSSFPPKTPTKPNLGPKTTTCSGHSDSCHTLGIFFFKRRRTDAMWGWKDFGWCWGKFAYFSKRVQVTSRRKLLTFWIEGIYLLVAFWFPIGTYLFDWIWKLKKKTR